MEVERNMGFGKKVKDKLPIERKDKKNSTEITERRPYDIWNEMDQLFDQFRTNFDDLFWGPRENLLSSYQNRAPLTDVVDHGDHYEMNIEMPGITKDNVNIEVTSNTIEVSAEEKETKDEKNKNWLRKERTEKKFFRSMELPEEFKTDNVEAEIKNGVLTVMLPKVEPKPKDKPKKVKIK
jgi:HSP20 family protein